MLNNTGINIRPDQEFLNCFGALPNLDGFEECRQREWWSPEDPPPNPPYETGDICHEEGILFIATGTTVDTPLQAASAWRPFYPNEDWVQPYNPEVQYEVGNKVVFDGRRYIVDYYVNAGTTPYSSAGWRVDDIYPWHQDMTYKENDIVIRNYLFFRAKWEISGQDPLTSGQWGAWENLGHVNEGLTALDNLNTCDNTVTPTQEFLNCFGAYPPVEGLSVCSSSDNYSTGDQCVFNGVLMQSVSPSVTGWPGSNINSWEIVYPDSDWVMPYNNNVRYSVGDKIIWQGKRFELISNVNAGINPTGSSSWRIDDIYEWDPNVVLYYQGDIVIHNDGRFYQAEIDTTSEPSTTPGGGNGNGRGGGGRGGPPPGAGPPPGTAPGSDWNEIGLTFNGNNADFYLTRCDSVTAQV